jgi:peptide/nickel transport system permease protein
MVVSLWAITLIAFIISHLIPADPVAARVGDFATEEKIQRVKHELGLDKPLPEQYVIYLAGLLRGDLGTSIRFQSSVRDEIASRLPATFELSTAAILISIAIGVPAGLLAAFYRNQWMDHLGRILALLGISMPIFWLGLLASALFYYKLGLLPAGGRLDPQLDPPTHITGLYVLDSILTLNLTTLVDSLQHLVLPAFVLGAAGAGSISRIMRSSMLEELYQDYTRTARAKGLRERSVLLKHALRNAWLPTVTTIGLTYGALLGGAVLTETVFAWPGLGTFVVAVMTNVDFAAVMGVTLVIAVIYNVVNFLVDLVYGYLDPRVTYD